MNEQEWQQFIAQHGGVIGQTKVLSKLETDVGQENPDVPHAVKYTFKDGSTISVMQGSDGSYQVTDPGTAFKPAQQPSQSSPDVRTVNGVPYQYNPQSKQWEPAPGIPAQQQQASSSSPDVRTVNGVPYQYNPQSKQWEPAPGIPASATDKTANEPTVTYTDLNGNQQQGPLSVANYYNNLAQQARAAATQKASLDWQQSQAAIQNQLASGRLSLDQAQQALTAEHDRITAQLQAQTNAVDYSKLIAPGLFSTEGLADFNSSLGSMAKGAGMPFTPITGISPSAPYQLAQQALTGQAGQGTAPAPATPPGGVSSGKVAPVSAPGPSAPASYTAPGGAPVGAYTAPGQRPLSPVNQAIQAGLGPTSSQPMFGPDERVAPAGPSFAQDPRLAAALNGALGAYRAPFLNPYNQAIIAGTM